MNFSLIFRMGWAIWGLAVLWLRPDLYHEVWARLLLLLAIWVWVPLALWLLDYPARWAPWVWGAGILAGVGLLLPRGWVAGVLILPWIGVQLGVFKQGIDHWWSHRGHPGERSVAAAQVFLIVGGLWTLADRLGWQPLGFDPAIVLLTGVHFHYAGFIFPLLCGWLYRISPHALSATAARLALWSVPFTAVGITFTQLGWGHIPEMLAAATVALSGWCAGIVFLQMAPRSGARIWAMIAGISLFFSMSLALGYALRFYFPLDFLQIPAMRALHGTANALGVSGAGLYFFAKAKIHVKSST